VLSKTDIEMFKYAVTYNYWYQMFIGNCFISLQVAFDVSSLLLFLLLLDDLPVWGNLRISFSCSFFFEGRLTLCLVFPPGFVGFTGESAGGDISSYLYTHREFSFSYNDDQVCSLLFLHILVIASAH